MKMIEKIIPNVKKCYIAPEVKILGVEEEYILAGGSPIQTEGEDPKTDGQGPAFSKQFGLGPIDDEETED